MPVEPKGPVPGRCNSGSVFAVCGLPNCEDSPMLAGAVATLVSSFSFYTLGTGLITLGCIGVAFNTLSFCFSLSLSFAN